LTAPQSTAVGGELDVFADCFEHVVGRVDVVPPVQKNLFIIHKQNYFKNKVWLEFVRSDRSGRFDKDFKSFSCIFVTLLTINKTIQ
jgi:hypothetical protein